MAPTPTYSPLPGNGDTDDAQHYVVPTPIRPATYYGQGPFDAPSSDEEDELLEKEHVEPPRSPGHVGALEEEGGLHVGSKINKRSSSLRCLVICLGLLVGLAAGIGVMAAMSYTGKSAPVGALQRITLDHVFNGTFSPYKQRLDWVPEAGDGVFSILQGGYITLMDLKTNKSQTLVQLNDIKGENGRPLRFATWRLSADQKYILLKADLVKQWRHSSFGNYYVHDLKGKKTYPIVPPSNPPDTAYAEWSPSGESIAFVKANDLYVLPTPDPNTKPIRITSTGNASLFHGVPDWVYEEEVFSGESALWWSPDSTQLAFLSLDETAVPEFVFPIYNPSENNDKVVPYTNEVRMKYPKPGYANPLASVHVFDLKAYQDARGDLDPEDATLTLEWNGAQAADNQVIQEVAWVGNQTLIVKEVNRAATNGSAVLFDLAQGRDVITGLSSPQGTVVRRLGKNGEEGDDGWIDASQHIYPLPAALAPGGKPAYLDVVPTPDGYNHIALFSPANNATPRFLTSGKWEVTSNVLGVDAEHGLVYFQAAKPSSIERNIYSVPLSSLDANELLPVAELTDASVPSFYTASFSPRAGFYLLSYDGPSVPWQRIVGAQGTASAGLNRLLTDNAELNATMQAFEMPLVSRFTIENDGFEMNALEMRPPRMDDSGRTKYPVLFKVYGGPGSQEVDARFKIDWHQWLVTANDYVVVVVDGRGTGYRGRKFRNPVKGNLGYWEVKDQIAAAKLWAAKPYVDSKRIGIWGWSYGGFMSSKVVEADAGVHSLSMAVAPVTSWLLYDSIYTERYMGLPKFNEGGYVNASVANVSAFAHTDYLLAHGSGDDNVHYANSAHLLDMFTGARVRGFRFRMFTDSDHSISRRGAYREIFEFLTEFIVEKWGKGGRRRAW